MPRMAAQGTRLGASRDCAPNSVAPPAAAGSGIQRPQPPSRDAADRGTGSGSAAEAEALAAIAMIAAGSRTAGDGPSKAVTGTLVVLGLMLAALILLVLLLSV